MTREEAIALLNNLRAFAEEDDDPAIDMAIEALQFIEHFDLLKEYQSLQEVVRCKDCIHQEHCHETIAHTKEHDGFREHWSETIEWCSRGKRKGGEDE